MHSLIQSNALFPILLQKNHIQPLLAGRSEELLKLLRISGFTKCRELLIQYFEEFFQIDEIIKIIIIKELWAEGKPIVQSGPDYFEFTSGPELDN